MALFSSPWLWHQPHGDRGHRPCPWEPTAGKETWGDGYSTGQESSQRKNGQLWDHRSEWPAGLLPRTSLSQSSLLGASPSRSLWATAILHSSLCPSSTPSWQHSLQNRLSIGPLLNISTSIAVALPPLPSVGLTGASSWVFCSSLFISPRVKTSDFTRSYELNVCVSPNSLCWTPAPVHDCFRSGGLWEVIGTKWGHERGAVIMGFVPS